MILRFYQDAEVVKKRALEGDQYVRICWGPKRGSIARVVDVKHITYSNHNFRLYIQGKKHFWVKGKFLEYLPDYVGETKLVLAQEPPTLLDMMGKRITMGCIIVFYKLLNTNATTMPELIIATVKGIKVNGHIVAHPIKASGDWPSNEVIILRTAKCLIIDRNLISELLLCKLST